MAFYPKLRLESNPGTTSPALVRIHDYELPNHVHCLIHTSMAITNLKMIVFHRVGKVVFHRIVEILEVVVIICHHLRNKAKDLPLSSPTDPVEFPITKYWQVPFGSNSKLKILGTMLLFFQAVRCWLMPVGLFSHSLSSGEKGISARATKRENIATKEQPPSGEKQLSRVIGRETHRILGRGRNKTMHRHSLFTGRVC